MQPALGWDKLGCSCSLGRNWGKLGIFALMTVEVSSWSRVLLLSVGLLAVSATGKCHGESWQLWEYLSSCCLDQGTTVNLLSWGLWGVCVCVLVCQHMLPCSVQ